MKTTQQQDREASLAVTAVTRTKFTVSGRARPFFGNTISAALISNKASSNLKELVRHLRRDERMSAFTFLPPETWHMTVMRGINLNQRHWKNFPRGIAPEATLGAASRQMSGRIAPVFMPRRIAMIPTRLECDHNDDIRLVLQAADVDQASRLSRLEINLKRALRHQRPDDGGTCHLTLAYRTRPFTLQRQNEVADIFNTLWMHEIKNNQPLIFSKPRLVIYDSMLDFPNQNRVS